MPWQKFFLSTMVLKFLVYPKEVFAMRVRMFLPRDCLLLLATIGCLFAWPQVAAVSSEVVVVPQSANTAPRQYLCYRARKPLSINGKIDERTWKRAAWTTDFVDIEGDLKPRPKFRTRVKMLWDDQYLYVAAELEEPDVKAKLTEHDSVIFHDNDFEVFLKPIASDTGYFEFEMNALNTGWDLFLNKPYRMGGKADNSWEMQGYKSAVRVRGTLNKDTDKDKGWTLEVAFPWSAFRSRMAVPVPGVGSEWRVNFSRVEWTTGQKREDNWVWSPQGVMNMHVPERWGFLRFAE